MNIIYIVLLLCAIYHVYASEQGGIGLVGQEILLDPIADSLESRGFREAVRNNALGAVWEIFEGDNDDLKKYCKKYFASLESSRIIQTTISLTNL